MKRALTVALLLLLVSAVPVVVTPTPAQAWPDVRVCHTHIPAPPVPIARRIHAAGKVSCWGKGTATLTTECQLQKLQGLGTRLRWTAVTPATRGVRMWVWSQACKVTAPREPGRWRVRVRHVMTGPNVVKRSGWNQSSAVTIR